MRSRKTEDLNANVVEGRISSALCLLANVAYRTKRTLEFDPATEKFVRDAEANKLPTRKYRSPYVVRERV